MTLFVRRLCTTAILPVRATQGAVGYDLAACLVDEAGAPRGPFAIAGGVIATGQRALVPTGLAIALPPETYGRIGPRSGLAVKHGIDVAAGIVDLDFRGEVGVVLVNNGKQPFHVEHGARIGQLVIERIALPDVVETDELPETQRGVGGFGSTGA
jgi:dUTP pyrophosphatase